MSLKSKNYRRGSDFLGTRSAKANAIRVLKIERKELIRTCWKRPRKRDSGCPGTLSAVGADIAAEIRTRRCPRVAGCHTSIVSIESLLPACDAYCGTSKASMTFPGMLPSAP